MKDSVIFYITAIFACMHMYMYVLGSGLQASYHVLAPAIQCCKILILESWKPEQAPQMVTRLYADTVMARST